LERQPRRQADQLLFIHPLSMGLLLRAASVVHTSRWEVTLHRGQAAARLDQSLASVVPVVTCCKQVTAVQVAALWEGTKAEIREPLIPVRVAAAVLESAATAAVAITMPAVAAAVPLVPAETFSLHPHPPALPVVREKALRQSVARTTAATLGKVLMLDRGRAGLTCLTFPVAEEGVELDNRQMVPMAVRVVRVAAVAAVVTKAVAAARAALAAAVAALETATLTFHSQVRAASAVVAVVVALTEVRNLAVVLRAALAAAVARVETAAAM